VSTGVDGVDRCRQVLTGVDTVREVLGHGRLMCGSCAETFDVIPSKMGRGRENEEKKARVPTA